MHLATSEQMFDSMAVLFLKKWKKEESEFCDYFKDTWLGSRKNWFEGASTYSPSHNNHVEGYNQAIKRDVTLRERLPLAQFAEAVLQMTRELSLNYAQHKREFATEAKVDLMLWREAASWAKSDVPQRNISSSCDETVVQVISSVGMEKGLTFERIDAIQQKKWSSFDQFVNEGFGNCWTVQVSTPDWKDYSKCECPQFQKNYVCKHILGVALREKICKLPRTAIPTMLEQKAKPGRKKKNTKALLLQ